MKKIWKIFKWILGIVVIIFILDIATILIFANLHPKLTKADAVVILGAAINSPVLYNRSLEGLRIYEQGIVPVMVLSGGRISDKDITEATYMERVMQKNTQKPLNIILEENSHSTFENLENTKAKIPKATSIIIVTDKYHVARSFLMAKAEGFKNVSWSTPLKSSEGVKDAFYHYFRETFALLAYIPKYLGK